MTRKSASSQRWRRRQDKDPYVERAVREGFRSRAAYKLQEIAARDRILRTGGVVVDLGASPGGWSQLAARAVGPAGRVFALDLLPMEPVPGVEFIAGDFLAAAVLEKLRTRLGEHPVDLVLSDMAPNISGNRAIDQPRSMALAEDALLFAREVLRPGGDFVVKLFQGEGFEAYVAGARDAFRRCRLIKPKASRPESREIYLLARNFGL